MKRTRNYCSPCNLKNPVYASAWSSSTEVSSVRSCNRKSSLRRDGEGLQLTKELTVFSQTVFPRSIPKQGSFPDAPRPLHGYRHTHVVNHYCTKHRWERVWACVGSWSKNHHRQTHILLDWYSQYKNIYLKKKKKNGSNLCFMFPVSL